MRSPLGTALVILMLVSFPAAVPAGTLNVRTWGADSVICGDKTEPCATIGQAITNADPKDKIVVGPGRYPEPLAIDKEGLKLESTGGARATIITTDGSGDDLVHITVDKVQLGKKGKGFTLLGGNSRGAHIEGDDCKIDSIRSIDNSADGFVLNGSDASFKNSEARDNGSDGFELSGDDLTVQDCVASGNFDDGFFFDSSKASFKRNVAHDNTAFGFTEGGDGANELKENAAWRNGGGGFLLGGDSVEVTKNVAADNTGHGFSIEFTTGAEVKDNLARGNTLSGFAEGASGAAAELEKNTAAGNMEHGFVVKTDDPGGIEFKKNNAYANGDCGLLNDTGGTLTTDATWWGQDPPSTTAGNTGADVCDNGNTTVTDPASKEGSLKVKGEL